MSNFPCSLTSNITPHSMENMAFHSLLRLKMIVLPNSHYLTYAFPYKRLGECTYLHELRRGANARPVAHVAPALVVRVIQLSRQALRQFHGSDSLVS